jgi:hypothetical protein
MSEMEASGCTWLKNRTCHSIQQQIESEFRPALSCLVQVDPHSRALGLRTAVLKGVSAADGQAYALRRIDGKQV